MMYPSPTWVEWATANAQAGATAAISAIVHEKATAHAAIRMTAKIIVHPMRLGAPNIPSASEPMNDPIPTALNRAEIPCADAPSTF